MKVPQYGTQRVQPEVEPSAKITAVPTPESLGAGVADVVSRLGSGFANDLLAKHKEQADTSALLDFDNKTAAFEQSAVYDPTTGAINTVKGQDAVGLSQKIGDAFDQFTGPLLAGLTPDQQQAAARLASARRQGIVKRLDSYASDQIDAFHASTVKDGLENSINLAVANATTDPARVALELQRQQLIIHGYAHTQGLSPEAEQAMQTSAATQTHKGVIEQMLANDHDQAAQVYFDQHKDEIAGTALTPIEAALKTGSLVGESQRQSDLILAHTANESDALDLAKTIQDPKLRDATEERITHAWTLKENADRQAKEKAYITATNQIEANPAKGIHAVDPTILSQLPAPERDSLLTYAKRLIEPGGEQKVNPQTYYSLMNMAGGVDPKTGKEDPTQVAAFAKLNLMTYINDLGNRVSPQFEQLTDIQKAIRDKKPVDDKLDGFRTNEQIFNDTLTRAGVSPKISTSGTSDNDKEIAKMRGALDDKVMALQRLTGKKANNEDVQGLMDDLMKTAVTQKGAGFFKSLLYGFSLPMSDTSKRIGDITVDDIPAADRAHIVDLLKGAGRPVTDASVLNLYLAGLRKSGAIK